MKLKTRRILYIFTILVFLILTPVILAYGFGLRYDKTSKTFIRTGGIYIDAHPKNVVISLDETTYESKTPVRLRYLWPKTYSLTIQQQGFLPLQTSIDIHQNEVVLFDSIELIPQQPTTMASLNAQYVFPSPYDSQALLFSKESDGHFSAYFLMNSELEKIDVSLPSSPDKITWNAVTGDAIIYTSTTNFIYTSATRSITKLPEGFLHPTLSAKESGIVYGSLDDQISFFDSKIKELQESPIQGALVYKHNGSYAVVRLSESAQTLIIRNGETETQIQEISDIQNIETVSTNFALIEDLRAYYLLDTQKKQITYLDSNVVSVAITNNALYYTNGLEVWSVNLTTFEKKLINRFSNRVFSIALSPHGSGLFIRLDGNTIFWYLYTPKTATRELENVDEYQKTGETEFRTFVLEDDTVIVRNYTF